MGSNDGLSIAGAIEQSVKRTFADMAFIDVEMNAEGASDFSTGQLIHISFSEPVEGEMVLFLPVECKLKIVENIYGTYMGSFHPFLADWAVSQS